MAVELALDVGPGEIGDGAGLVDGLVAVGELGRPLEEPDGDDHPEEAATDQLHDHAGHLLVVDDRHAPHPVRHVVGRVDRPLGEGEPPGRDGRDDRRHEQVEHLARVRDAQLRQRPDHRHPQHERREHQNRVQHVVRHTVLDRQVHHARCVREQQEAVEHQRGGDGFGEEVEHPLDPAAAEHHAGEPLGRRQQHHGRHQVGEHHVLRHVHREQVVLADVVHGPVGGQPQEHQPQTEPPDLLPADRRRACGDHLGTDHAQGVDGEHGDTPHQHPDLRVRLPPPEVGSGGEHGHGISLRSSRTRTPSR